MDRDPATAAMAVLASAPRVAMAIVAIALLTPTAHGLTTIDVSGALTFGSDQGRGCAISVLSGGNASFGSSQYLDGLTVATSGRATLLAGGNKVLATNTAFTIDGSSGAYTGTVDLNDNAALFKLSAGNPTLGTWTGTTYNGATGMLASAYAAGRWTNGGIQSTTASLDTTRNHGLGVLTAGQAQANGHNLVALGFHGETVAANDVLVQYGWNGDLNFDNVVNYLDYGVIDNAFLYNRAHTSAPERGYNYGDVNFDGVINYLDYGIMDNAFLAQNAPHAAAMTASSVPEPASLCLLTAGVLLLARRRRA